MTTWKEAPNSVLHTKRNGDTFILRVGDCITYKGRDLPVKVTRFTGKEEVIGFCYLPWRGTRWATPVYNFNGDVRHMICYPGGLEHCGQHMDWESVEIVPNPEKIEETKDIVHQNEVPVVYA